MEFTHKTISMIKTAFYVESSFYFSCICNYYLYKYLKILPNPFQFHISMLNYYFIHDCHTKICLDKSHNLLLIFIIFYYCLGNSYTSIHVHAIEVHITTLTITDLPMLLLVSPLFLCYL